MACDTPIIASFDLDSELANVIQAAKAGICVEPSNADAFCDAILHMVNNPLQVSTRQYVQDHYSKESLLEKYLHLFK